MNIQQEYELSGDVRFSLKANETPEIKQYFIKEVRALMSKYKIVKIDLCLDPFLPLISQSIKKDS